MTNISKLYDSILDFQISIQVKKKDIKFIIISAFKKIIYHLFHILFYF